MASFYRIGCGVFGTLLLAALIFPIVQSGSWDNTGRRRASCMSNMKQLGLALSQYTQDYGTLPPGATASHPSGWREAIYPYVKSTGVYRCPDDQRDNSHASPDNLPKSYAANALCFGGSRKPIAFVNLSPTAILAADTRGYDGEDWNIVSPAFLPSNGREMYTHKPSHYFYQHPSGMLNCLFADGHVKAMKPDATLMSINLWTPNNTPFAGQELSNARAVLTHAEKE